MKNHKIKNIKHEKVRRELISLLTFITNLMFDIILYRYKDL